MCSSENELIHDTRQVDLEEIIVTKPTYYLVPATLTNQQRSDFFLNLSESEGGPDGAEDMISAVGIPIPPRADVETVGWMARASKETPTALREVVGNIPYDCGNYDDLVFRTDMEAQVALRDADIKRLKMTLSDIWCTLLQAAEGENSIDNWADAISQVLLWSNAALNEGSGA